ncbi:hypothetical protein SCHPADRAFT_521211 [Schizopora paradoxa]|uniref:Uncharacterized protein n=1 Tax=Schizopora paradoxa TaxID=27342 RepID=A0A0H2RF03_9AGAM|nr:hypothetical protein SCHPADRAFT_521211 [Schizopora paradoxa]
MSKEEAESGTCLHCDQRSRLSLQRSLPPTTTTILRLASSSTRCWKIKLGRLSCRRRESDTSGTTRAQVQLEVLG